MSRPRGMWSSALARSLMLLSLTTCESTGRGTSGCLWVKPIYVSTDDVLTPATARAILEHDETWAAECRGK